MSEHVNPKLPFAAKCPACGRHWVQTELWPLGSLLTCQCGANAELDEPEPVKHEED